MTIWFCGDEDIPVDRRISAPNLMSFRNALYDSHSLNLVLVEYVPKLTCSCCLTTQSVNQPELPNLKSLTVKDLESITDVVYSRFVALLKAAPLLENLTFERDHVSKT
ncbi:hypothetical protein ACFE04_024797 [Oxalis oulophora]